MSVYFNGQLLVTPVTASAVNDDAMLNQNLSVGNNIAFIGESEGGQPMTILAFGTPDDARDALLGGELCDAVTAAFAPSQDTGGPQTVYAIRVGHATPATLDLVCDAKDTSKVLLKLSGKHYSTSDQTISVKVEEGSTGKDVQPDLRTITVTQKTDIRTGVDVNASPLMVEITEENVELTVGETGMTVVVDKGADEEKSWEIGYTQFPTLDQLVTYANGLKNAEGNAALTLTVAAGTDPSFDPSVFDQATYTTGEKAWVTLNGYAIKQWFESACSDLLYVEPGEDPTCYSEGLVVSDYQYLKQEAAEPATNDDWSSALDMLQTKDIQWVHAVSGEGSIHAMVNAHCTFCSDQLRRERRAICGTEAGTSDIEAIAAAKALNSKRVSLVHIGHYAYDNTGKLTLRPAYMTAGLVAAAFAGVNAGTPLTNKTLSVAGLERDLRNPTDTDALILGGVMPIENTETGYRITQSITTWLGDTKYNNREQSCGVAIDFTVRNVRQAVDVLRGSKQTPILLSRAVSIAKTTLTELARAEPQGPAVLVGDENSPAWRNVTATMEGDVLRLQFEASPVIPNNYILVTMYARPYSGSATA